MKRKRFTLVCLAFFMIPWLLGSETAIFGEKQGWGQTISMGLRQTDGWRGHPAITLEPLNRNPFATKKEEAKWIDLLLLAEPAGILNPPEKYWIEGDYQISRQVAARSGRSIHPGSGGIKLYPSPGSMWAPGTKWGNFSLDFLLQPITLRDGESIFHWQGRDSQGTLQTVTAKVDKRRLIWEFRNFFRQEGQSSLNIKLLSSPLIPGQWQHHHIRFYARASNSDKQGASPGYLEYLIDGYTVDSLHTTVDGKESLLVYIPRIGQASNQPVILAPNANVYLDEFRLSSIAQVDTPTGNYVIKEDSAFGAGRTEPINTGYPGSSLLDLRTRLAAPGLSQVRFFVRRFNNLKDIDQIGLPQPGDRNWVELNMVAQPQDPMGFGRWYTGKTARPLKGRYFVIGYLFYPDPSADSAPIVSAIELDYEPRVPPRPPRDILHRKDARGNTLISWSPHYDPEIAGWWIYWGARSGDYTLNSMIWVPSMPGSEMRPEYVWPPEIRPLIAYVTIRAAWSDGGPNNFDPPQPANYDALSSFSREINFRP